MGLAYFDLVLKLIAGYSAIGCCLSSVLDQHLLPLSGDKRLQKLKTNQDKQTKIDYKPIRDRV